MAPMNMDEQRERRVIVRPSDRIRICQLAEELRDLAACLEDTADGYVMPACRVTDQISLHPFRLCMGDHETLRIVADIANREYES